MKNNSVRSFLLACLRAVCCLLLGLLIGAAVWVALAWAQLREADPAAGFSEAAVMAMENGLLPFLRGGLPESLPVHFGRAVPVVLLSLGAAFAWQAGLYNLGGAGQYALGAAAAVGCAFLGAPWYGCLAAAALSGGVAGLISGGLKARFQAHEALTTVLMNWLAIYGAQAFLQSVSGGMGLLPDLYGAALIVTAVLTALVFILLRFTVPGFEIRVMGDAEAAARYAGMNTGKIIVWTMSLSGLLGGMAGGFAFLLGGFTKAPTLTLALTGPGMQGIAAAVLACGHPLGAALFGLAAAHLAQGSQAAAGTAFPQEAGEMILAVILYAAAFLMLPGGKRKERGGKE